MMGKLKQKLRNFPRKNKIVRDTHSKRKHCKRRIRM